MTLTTIGVDTLIDCLKVLQLIADERTSYAENFREEKDFSALAAKLLMKDMEAMWEPATIPDPAAVERMEEQLDQLFTAAHIILHTYTCLGDS